MKRLLGALLPLIAACTQSGGLGYTNIDVDAQNQDGTAVPEFPDNTCTTLPILLGSRIQERFAVADGVVVELVASRDLVRVDFVGVSPQSPQGTQVSVEQLDAGYAEQFELESTAGSVFVIAVRGGCP
jgi:hypothetical protein